MKLVIDPDLCIACGTCTLQDPSTFNLKGAGGKAKVIKQPTTLTQPIRNAIEACPTGAISVKD